jgi:hypothetical protein
MIKKRGDVSQDSEVEQQASLISGFLELGFTRTEAAYLAVHWADPVQIAWWLQQGCSHRHALEIAT